MNKKIDMPIEAHTEWGAALTAEQETKINIGEVYFDQRLGSILNKDEFTAEVQKMNKEIEDYLGKNTNSTAYDFRIYSDRKEYESYLITNFPDKFEGAHIDNATFYYNKDMGKKIVVAKFIEAKTLDPNDPNVQKYLEKEGISFDQLTTRIEENYKNNIYPSVAHEMAHLHPFFGGVGNEASDNKWEQEMVCVFIDQKMWEKYNKNFKEMIEDKSREQVQDKDLYNEIIRGFKEENFEFEEWEQLFYPFLEKRYGKEKLIKFWNVLFKHKANFEPSFEIIFGEKLKDVMDSFQKKIAKKEN